MSRIIISWVGAKEIVTRRARGQKKSYRRRFVGRIHNASGTVIRLVYGPKLEDTHRRAVLLARRLGGVHARRAP